MYGQHVDDAQESSPAPCLLEQDGEEQRHRDGDGHRRDVEDDVVQEGPRQLLVEREAGEELDEVVEAGEVAADRALPLEEAEEERLDRAAR